MRLNGLSSREVERSRKEYGLNHLTKMPDRPFIQRFGSTLKNPFMLAAAAALLVQAAMFVTGHLTWLLPAETLAAVVVFGIVSAAADRNNAGSAAKVFDDDKTRQSAKVVRDGGMMEVQFNQVVAGDMILLQNGDKIPADGEIVYGRITVDQSFLGGETQFEKIPAPERIKDYDKDDLNNRYYVHRGSVVIGGEAYMYVKAVGDKTLFGRRAVHDDLRIKKMPKIHFVQMMTRKAFLGYAFGFCILAAVLISVFDGQELDLYHIITAVSALLAILGAVGFFLTRGVHLLTEGYIYSRFDKLLSENILFRDIGTFFKIQGIKTVLMDKTGAFTDGKFTVSRLAAGDGSLIEVLGKMPESFLKEICIGIGMNNSSNASGAIAVGGEKTDRVLLSYLIGADVMGTVIRQAPLKLKGYDVEKKYASAVAADGNIYIKGNAKAVVNMCTSCTDIDGHEMELDRERTLAYLSEQDLQGNRVIAAAKSTGNDSYILLCMVSLKDNAVNGISELIQKSHARIVMLTSDSKECAFAAAKSAGLIQQIGEVKEFSEMTSENFRDIKAVANLLPEDKRKILGFFRENGLKTAVIADSVYDTEMLREADVGIAFQSASDSAKNAADMILLDDNILSLQKIIK